MYFQKYLWVIFTNLFNLLNLNSRPWRWFIMNIQAYKSILTKKKEIFNTVPPTILIFNCFLTTVPPPDIPSNQKQNIVTFGSLLLIAFYSGLCRVSFMSGRDTCPPCLFCPCRPSCLLLFTILPSISGTQVSKKKWSSSLVSSSNSPTLAFSH